MPEQKEKFLKQLEKKRITLENYLEYLNWKNASCSNLKKNDSKRRNASKTGSASDQPTSTCAAGNHYFHPVARQTLKHALTRPP